MRFLTIILLAMVAQNAAAFEWGDFFEVLTATESGGRREVVGDTNLQHKAYGVLQIRQPYLDDVNEHCRKVILEHWGRPLTLDDVKEPAVARWVAVQYLTHYGKRYTRITGKRPTFEVLARIHNGGPNGWRRSSTDEHWRRFQEKATRLNIEVSG